MNEIREHGGKDTILDKFISKSILDRQYQFVSKDKFKAAIYLDQPIYSREVHLGNSIYETQLFGNFVVFHPEKWPNCLIIESKWQKSSGSVDEKFPYFILNIKEKYPYHTVILLDGGGYKKEAADWMHKQIGGTLLNVFNRVSFQKWLDENYL